MGSETPTKMVLRTTYNSRIMLAFITGLSIGATLSLVGQYAMQDYIVFGGRVKYIVGTTSKDTDPFDCSELHAVAHAPVPCQPSMMPTDTLGEDNVEHLPSSDKDDSSSSASFSIAGLSEATNVTDFDDTWMRAPSVDIRRYLQANRTAMEAHEGEDELAQEMFTKIRILCWVMTQPANHETRAKTVKQTWGKRCNVFFFVSTAQVDNETTAIYHANESRDILWGKTKLGFQYAYDNYFDDADWFVKADDDTYMIMENMRLLLLDKDPATPVHYGCKYKVFVQQGYMSGGSGYVLSKEALRLFVEESIPDPLKCNRDNSGAEDAEIGFCLQNVGAAAGDSRDQEGKPRFFPFAPQDLVAPGPVDMSNWYWKNIYYMHEQGIECCSDSVIAFHYIDVKLMWTMEYFIYHVHPFGIIPQLTGSKISADVIRYLTNQNVTAITKTLKSASNKTVHESTEFEEFILASAKKVISKLTAARNAAKRRQST